MIAMANKKNLTEYVVVHPLDDTPEEKCNPDNLGRMTLTPGTRFCMMLLRGYLVLMMGLVAYHLLDMAGAFGHKV